MTIGDICHLKGGKPNDREPPKRPDHYSDKYNRADPRKQREISLQSARRQLAKTAA